MITPVHPLVVGLLIPLGYGSAGISQERPRGVFRASTDVVLVDVSVKDAKSNAPVRDLRLDNFKVFDDGKPRAITHFSREGDTRRPLSLLLFIDLWTMYGRKYITQPMAMDGVAEALRQLAPEDEVAVMTTWIEAGDSRGVAVPMVRMLSDFTRDRQRTASAIGNIPRLVSEQEALLEAIARGAGRSEWDIELAWRPTEIAETIMKQNDERSDTQFVVVALIDDLFAFKRGEREHVGQMGARASVTFYGLVYKRSVMGKLVLGTVNQIFMRPRGGSLRGAEYLAEQTGGQVMSIGQPRDLATGLHSVIADQRSRYVLGFSLDDRDYGDGRIHRLEVTVEVPDARGQKRRLRVTARKSYYLPAENRASSEVVPDRIDDGAPEPAPGGRQSACDGRHRHSRPLTSASPSELAGRRSAARARNIPAF